MGGRSEVSDAGGWREYSQLPTQAPIVLTSNMWYLMALTAKLLLDMHIRYCRVQLTSRKILEDRYQTQHLVFLRFHTSTSQST